MRRLIDTGNRPITPKPHIGHYGRLRKAYLEQYRHRLYTALVASEKLYPHLAETDRAARDMLDYLIPRFARKSAYSESSLSAYFPTNGRMRSIMRSCSSAEYSSMENRICSSTRIS